jgi:hypothetical protein
MWNYSHICGVLIEMSKRGKVLFGVIIPSLL